MKIFSAQNLYNKMASSGERLIFHLPVYLAEIAELAVASFGSAWSGLQ
jgi:hypothetical protein